MEPIVTDQAGMYTVMKCFNRETSFLLVNTYGPNYDDPQFYINMANIMGGSAPTQIFGGGILIVFLILL